MFKMTIVEYCNKWNQKTINNLPISLIHDYDLNTLINSYEDDEVWEKIEKSEIKHGKLPWASLKTRMKGIAANTQEVVDAYRTAISILMGL